MCVKMDGVIIQWFARCRSEASRLELPVRLKLEDSIFVCVVSGVGGEYLPLCASTQAYTSGSATKL